MFLHVKHSYNRTHGRLRWIYNKGVKEVFKNPNEGAGKYTRRHLLQAITAFGVAAALALEQTSAKSLGPRTLPEDILSDPVILRQRISASERAFRDPNVQAQLESTDILGTLAFLTNHTIEPDWERLRGTEFDTRELERRVVLFGIDKTPSGDALRLASYERASLEDVLTLADADQGRMFGYGQAIPVSRTKVLLPQHILQHFKNVANVHGTPNLAYDAATAELVGVHFKPQEIAHFSHRTDADLHGKFIAITGIDPDDRLGRTGRKIYGGIAVKMTRTLCEHYTNRFSSPIMKRALSKALLVVCENDDMSTVLNTRTGTAEVLAAGFSGGLVGVHADKRYEECGLLFGGGGFTYAGKNYSVYFMHGPDVIMPVVNRALPQTPRLAEQRSTR